MKRLRIVSVVLSTLLVLAGLPLVANNSALAATGDVEINETNFPDEGFRYYITHNIDADGSGSLSAQEIANTTSMYLDYVGSIEGINYFTSLQSLSYSHYDENLVLDVSGLPSLTRLAVFNRNPAYGDEISADAVPSIDEALGSTRVILNSYLSSIYSTVIPTQRSLPYGYWQERFLYDWVSDGNVALTLQENAVVVSSVNMYRLYNPNSGEHFYTANEAERNTLIGLGWNDEGIGWIAPSTSNSPVYRLYNENAGEHHYTMSMGERDALVEAGWKYEGIGWYSDDSQRVPLYRQYNPNAYANNHNYTTSLRENDDLVALGWRAEAIGWYGIG